METLVEYLKTAKSKGFTPRPHYSAEGDSLTFYIKDEPSYRERIDDFLTIYRSIKMKGLVGCQIKRLPKALEILGDFGLVIKDGRVLLGMIFMACMTVTPKPEAKKTYRELGRMAGSTSIPAEELKPFLN